MGLMPARSRRFVRRYSRRDVTRRLGARRKHVFALHEEPLREREAACEAAELPLVGIDRLGLVTRIRVHCMLVFGRSECRDPESDPRAARWPAPDRERAATVVGTERAYSAEILARPRCAGADREFYVSRGRRAGARRRADGHRLTTPRQRHFTRNHCAVVGPAARFAGRRSHRLRSVSTFPAYLVSSPVHACRARALLIFVDLWLRQDYLCRVLGARRDAPKDVSRPGAQSSGALKPFEWVRANELFGLKGRR